MLVSFSAIISSCRKDDPDDEQLLVKDYDGNVYNTVKIGSQRWFVQNLKTTRYNDGSIIPNITSNSIWASSTNGAYCWYDNNITMKNDFGALYNWNVVASGKLCPVGWHIPSDEEWDILAEYLGGEGIAGGKLKDASASFWKAPNTGASNILNYSALPGGYRIHDGSFHNIYERGIWWTSSEIETSSSNARMLDYEYSSLIKRTYGKSFGLSVRCIKD